MIWFTRSLANYNVYFTSNPKVTSPKTSTLTQRNSAHTFKTNMEYRHQLSAFDNVIIIIIVQELLQSNFHRLLKKLIYNSPSGSDDTIGRFLIEAKLVQATPRTDCTRRISSSNLVVDRGTSQSFSHPSGANLHINFVSDRVNTCSNPSPKIEDESLYRFICSTSIVRLSHIQYHVWHYKYRHGRGYFVRNTTRTESEVLSKQVVVPKDKRSIPGSRERGIHYLEATGALDPTFGAARNFVPTSWEGESDNQYNNIEKMYVGNLHKSRGVRKRCVKFDMVDPLKFPTMIYVTTNNPSFQWGVIRPRGTC